MDGELVDYRPAGKEDGTLWFSLPDAPDEWEGIRCKAESDGRAEVVGIPIFAFDVNLGDLVRVVASAGADVAGEVIANGGNHTTRVMFERESHAGEHWGRLMEDLEPLDCWFETWSETLVAISVGSVNLHAVTQYLSAREARRELRYETARST